MPLRDALRPNTSAQVEHPSHIISKLLRHKKAR
jgi:hypothetical protein